MTSTSIEPASWSPREAATTIPDRHQSFVLWPHRSLSRCGMCLVMGGAVAGFLVAILMAPGNALLPIAVPAALAVAALSLAFFCNTRAARFCERIEVGPARVRFERTGPAAALAGADFNTAWVRVNLSSDRYVESRITLEESGRAVSVGEFLTPEERERLALALRASIRSASRAWQPKASGTFQSGTGTT